MRTTSEIVAYLTRHYQEKTGEIQEDLLPEAINDLIQDMGAFLEEHLEEDTPHKLAWDAFAQNPEENAASLAGILEAVFEAQPAVRERVDGFMQKVTAIETKHSTRTRPQIRIENKLQAEPGNLITDEAEESAILADKEVQKNPPAFLYGNEQAGFESERELPESNEFLVGKNAQIIYMPSEKMQFPFMFMRLGQLSESSKNLTIKEKQIVQENLQEIRFQLTEERPFDATKMANAFEAIWEVAPSYANALIASLQDHIDELPVKTRDFIIQLHSPLH